MKIEYLKELFKNNDADVLNFEGKCHTCCEDVNVYAFLDSDGGIRIEGGAVYKPEFDSKIYLKCQECYDKNKILKDFRECEVYSRIVGYLRPVNNWNNAKQEEFKNRKYFNIEGEKHATRSTKKAD